MKLGFHLFDAVRLASRVVPPQRLSAGGGLRLIPTPAGFVRVRDTGPAGSHGATVILAPDGPNVIEHYDGLVDRLAGPFRVVVLDLPGFGFSYPSTDYRFRLDDVAEVVLAVMDALEIEKATLSFPCANGYYAAATARMAPDRVQGLVLVQTPSYRAMRAWTARTIPRIVRLPGLGQVLMSLAER